MTSKIVAVPQSRAVVLALNKKPDARRRMTEEEIMDFVTGINSVVQAPKGADPADL